MSKPLFSTAPSRTGTLTSKTGEKPPKNDRKPNPHLSFGFGTHLCLGAPHARLILRTLLRLCCEHVQSITILHAQERTEHEATFDRTLGYDSLTVSLTPR